MFPCTVPLPGLLAEFVRTMLKGSWPAGTACALIGSKEDDLFCEELEGGREECKIGSALAWRLELFVEGGL